MVHALGPRGRDDWAYLPFPFPRIPAQSVEHAASWLRTIWTRSRKVAAWMLYIEVEQRTWYAGFPPQIAGNKDFRCDLRYMGCDDRPGPHHRIAGFLRTDSAESIAHPSLATPPADGVYLFYNPRRSWLHLTAVLRVGSAAETIPVETILTDDDRGHARLDGRLWITDSSAIL